MLPKKFGLGLPKWTTCVCTSIVIVTSIRRQRELLVVRTSNRLSPPPIVARGPVLPGQSLFKASWCIKQEWRDHPQDDWQTLYHTLNLPDSAVLFVWVYYSIVGWTEWPNPTQNQSTNWRSCQADQLLWLWRWPLSVINTMTEAILCTYIQGNSY